MICKYNKMKYVEIASDGNCLFNSISFAISNSYKHGKILRELAVDYLKKNKDTYKDYIHTDIEKYISKMSNDGVYGDEIMLNIISIILNVKISIYDFHDHRLISVYDNSNGNINKKNINLFYDTTILHYNTIIDIN